MKTAKFKPSTMRFAFKVITIASFIIMLSLAAYIVINAIKGNMINSWSSMGVFAIGVGTITTGMGYMKKEQKKVENDTERDNIRS